MQRCRAMSKRSGEQCKNFAIKACGVCRMHGAHGGPKTHEGFLSCKNAPLKHGYYTQEAKEEMLFMRMLMENEKETKSIDMKANCWQDFVINHEPNGV